MRKKYEDYVRNRRVVIGADGTAKHIKAFREGNYWESSSSPPPVAFEQEEEEEEDRAARRKLGQTVLLPGGRPLSTSTERARPVFREGQRVRWGAPGRKLCFRVHRNTGTFLKLKSVDDPTQILHNVPCDNPQLEEEEDTGATGGTAVEEKTVEEKAEEGGTYSCRIS
jgi:hypothetical protein